jgi:hypothetical protein
VFAAMLTAILATLLALPASTFATFAALLIAQLDPYHFRFFKEVQRNFTRAVFVC